jgi:hypothetical protein
LYGKTYLVDCPKHAFETLKQIIVSADVLHVALTPETKVLYVFIKPRPGLVESVVSRALKVSKALSTS